MSWSATCSFVFFFMLNRVKKLRVGYIYEITGMDILVEGGSNILSADIISKIEAKQRDFEKASNN